jgi:uncharacterized membrane protein YcjF (UPF0283 family)
MPEPAAAHPASSAPDFWDQVNGWFRWVKVSAYSLAGLFVVILAVEAVRLYRLAAEAHPLAGVATVALMLGAGALVIVPAYRFLRVPRVVEPPRLPQAGDVRLAHLAGEVRYLERYLDCCLRNPALAGKHEAVEEARGSLADLGRRIRAARRGPADRTAALDAELRDWVDATMPPLLAELDSRAERTIYEEALHVGLATAVSPNGTLDAFVMLWRSVGLASKLATLYYGRPGLLGTLAVCRDVSLATAAAAYLHNVTDSLGSLLAKSIGRAGSVVAGPAIEGITNALVLIRIGYLTQERCRSFRRWDTEARRSAIARALAATQKVALGLTAEILRKVGTGLGFVAGAAVSGVAQVASAAAEGVASAAESAKGFAKELGGRIGGFFRGKGSESPGREDEGAGERPE